MTEMIKIKVVNKGNQKLPEYATPLSAGMDLRADIAEDIVLKPMQRRIVPTGLHIALPAGYEAQVRPRSGLALKHGITVLNSPGTIDADYRGEIGACESVRQGLYNHLRRTHSTDGDSTPRAG